MGLSYESFLALRQMRDQPDQEGSAIAKACDCSWDELFKLAELGLIDAGMGRLLDHQMHPVITGEGRAALAKAETEGIL